MIMPDYSQTFSRDAMNICTEGGEQIGIAKIRYASAWMSVDWSDSESENFKSGTDFCSTTPI